MRKYPAKRYQQRPSQLRQLLDCLLYQLAAQHLSLRGPVDNSDSLPSEGRHAKKLSRMSVCPRSIQIPVVVRNEQVHCKQWCFFSAPIFPPLAIIIDESGFDWRRR
jgi:hypothetical protein